MLFVTLSLGVITKLHRSGGLHDPHLFLIILETRKSRTKVLIRSVPVSPEGGESVSSGPWLFS